MKRVAIVVGTRPEAIKLAPVILGLRAHPRLQGHVCATAQHRAMMDQALGVFDVTPDVDLDLMVPDQTLAGLTARAVSGIDEYLQEHRPDLVLIQGDTTTVLAAALAAFYRRIPVGHVEAGLRTGDFDAPWPEEANRVLATRLTSIHFAPTAIARHNLLAEGIAPSRVHVTGNTVVDALLIARAKVTQTQPEVPGLNESILAPGTQLVLITGHRRESFGDGFENICQAIALLSERFPSARFVYPVHLNPHVREPVQRILGSGKHPNVHLIEPIAYLPFVRLMDRCDVLLTDSGGIQEEAPSLHKPVLVMRDTTERPEAVNAGVARLVGTRQDAIVQAVSTLLTDSKAYASMATGNNPYGDGRASSRIIALCEEFLGIDA